MIDYGLSRQQLTVICALSSGATSIAAAQQAGVHRNTIANWRRNELAFQQAFTHAQYDRALYFREKIEAEVDLAIQSLHDLLADPKTPPSIRLKAALAILNTASKPPEPKKQVILDIEKIVLKRTQNVAMPETPPAEPKPAPEPEPASNVHNPAQPAPQIADPAQPKLHNHAQIPVRRELPKVGRNEVCPCGSGKKFKRCCLERAA